MKVQETARAYRTAQEKFTFQDYLALPDDGKRYELIEGELIMAAAPRVTHQIVNYNLVSLFIDYFKKNKVGTLLFAPCDVVLDEYTVVEPDIIFVSKENKSILTEENIQGAPDLLVEILSIGTAYYDLLDKKDLYEKHGVKEYWIVDPRGKWIAVYILKEGKYELLQKVEKEGVAASVILKGLEVNLTAVFKLEI